MRPRGPMTRAVHAGGRVDPSGAAVSPIVQASTFAFPSTAALSAVALGRRPGNFYTRYGNPNQSAAQEKLAAMEGAQAALVFGSGMAAISSALLAHVRPGQRLLAFREIYGGTLDLIRRVLVPFGVRVDAVGVGEEAALRRALRRRPRVLYLETPTNPTLRVVDIAAVSRLARASGALTFVDSTFATPMNTRPLALGADLSIHSATKYLGGHSDLTGGAVAGSREIVAAVAPLRRCLGGILAPHDAWLLERSLKTLPLRMARHNANGLAVARFLGRHPRVLAVHYPGLPGHPDHALAARQMRGFGGVLAFEPRGGFRAARRLADRLRLARLAPSLGGADTLVSHPALTSHAGLSRRERAALGIPEGLVRVALGLEDADDLIADFDQALAGIA